MAINNVLNMSVSDWMEVPDNPRQRDTERRAEYGRRKHLATYAKPHEFVYAATKNGEILCKLDGHTRAFLWMSGDLEHPPSGSVTVLLIPVQGMSEAKEIYEQLDSPVAYKRVCDSVFGATREQKFRLKSSLLAKCQFGTQLKMADSGKFAGDAAKLVKKWKSELLVIDSWNLPKVYPTLISAMLLSVRSDGVDLSGEFWNGLTEDKGTKTNAGADGIELLKRHMEIRKVEGRTAGYDNVKDTLSVALYC